MARTTANDKLPPSILVIFGITGDLANRKLLPALYHLSKAGLLPREFKIVGITRRGVAVAELLSTIEQAIESTGQVCDKDILKLIGRQLSVVTMDITDAQEYLRLKGILDDIEETIGQCMNRLIYLAIPSNTFGPVVDHLGKSHLNAGCQHQTATSRLLIEKPFGYNLRSAQELVERLKKSFSENLIYRVDHFLAKETAQNILTFRFANPMFEHIWDRQAVSSITITAHESIGIEGRVVFYEQTGALRDIVQSHLLQLLALIAMEKPKDMTATAIHTERLRLLESISPIKPNQVDKLTARGQYDTYAVEVGNLDSITETYASVRLNINNKRWKGVPILVRSGKKVPGKVTEIVLKFNDKTGEHGPNSLTVRIQPNEGIVLSLAAKRPGLDNQTDTVAMEFCYDRQYDVSQPDAYERVLVDAIRGDKTLFATSAEVLAAWRILDNVVQQWSLGSHNLEIYDSGSLGPKRAQTLV